jgi:Tol biopolymer transport system component
MYLRALPVAKIRTISFTLGLFSLIAIALFVSCQIHSKTPATIVTRPAPSIAYLHEGELWTMMVDGKEATAVASAPADEVITDFLWSNDGEALLYAIGSQINRLSLLDGKTAGIGAPQLPADLGIDRLELSRTPQVIIIHTTDADGQNRTFSYSLNDQKTLELSIDGYNRLAPLQSAIVRQMTDLSVAPDLNRLLFKAVPTNHEELFVADLETGARQQITDLNQLDGFEPTSQFDGVRHILEASWSPDGRFAIFNPSQSCSEMGLCYGRVYLVDSWSGRQQRLSEEMVVTPAVDWAPDSKRFVFEDGGHITIGEVGQTVRRLTEGSRPKWRPKR